MLNRRDIVYALIIVMTVLTACELPSSYVEGGTPVPTPIPCFNITVGDTEYRCKGYTITVNLSGTTAVVTMLNCVGYLGNNVVVKNPTNMTIERLVIDDSFACE